MFSYNGLVALFTALSITNRTLKFLDITCNFIEVGIVHALRQMIERSPTLKYLTISDLHKFNSLAVQGIVDSLVASQGLKMVDFR
jgi:hypothetical protein